MKPTLPFTDRCKDFERTTLVPDGPYSASGTATFSGLSSASFVLESLLRVATDGNATSDFEHTALLDSFVVTGGATLSDASGMLRFDRTSYTFPAVSPLPEPAEIVLFMSGLAAIGLVNRRQLKH